jgi:hypothetical protein
MECRQDWHQPNTPLCYAAMPHRLTITVSQPCQEQWGHMQPAPQGRHCGACQQAVVDFTAMTDAAVVAFLAQPTNRGRCGRFRNDQLNRNLHAQPLAPRPWTALLTAAAAALAACSSPTPDSAVAVRQSTDQQSVTVADSAEATVAQAKPTKKLHPAKAAATAVEVIEPLPIVDVPDYRSVTMGLPAYTEPDSATALPPDSTRVR